MNHGRSLLTLFLLSGCASLTCQSLRQAETVPFVGCASDGMSGPEAAPTGLPKRLFGIVGNPERLTYYSAAEGFGALAPRGWFCQNVYGSDGGFLVISPRVMSADAVIDALQKSGFQGPAVVATFTLGFTSGRDEITPVILRVFPAHMRFVRDVAKSFDRPRPKYLGPLPFDHLHYLSKSAVTFTTPAGKSGIGTIQSHMTPSSEPISGAHFLVKEGGDCCDLSSIAVRLSASDDALSPVIVRQFEQDTRRKSEAH